MEAPVEQSSGALSPATAALADGDDIRARFILRLQALEIEERIFAR